MTTVFVKADEKNKENLDNVHILKPHDTSRSPHVHSTRLSYGDSLKPITDDIVHNNEVKEVLPQNIDDIEHKFDIDHDHKLPREPEYNFTTTTSSITSLRRLSFASSTNCNFGKLELNIAISPHDEKAHDLQPTKEASSTQSIETIEEYVDPLSDADMSCIGKDIDNCIGLQRIISLMSFYATHYAKYGEINAYLTKYNLKTHLINDYHHILDKHLNDDTVSMRKMQKQFELIYREMVDINGLFCDISRCDIFKRHHRRRETTQINCDGDEQLAVFVDILDTMHCYFMHCVDIGHRMIGNQYKRYMTCKDGVNLRQLADYLNAGESHIAMKSITAAKDGRFVTKLTQRNGKMCGYLRKESMYLKQIRLRYIVLYPADNHLYSYKTERCVELTESIDLNEYSYVQISESGPVGQFELISHPKNGNKTTKKRVFIAPSQRELDLWLSALKAVMAREKTTHFAVGERFDYWSNDSAYPKYESIREELTNNKILRISRAAFECAFNKAIYLHNCHKIRNMMSCRDVIEKYHIRYDATPRVEHILAVILWCDYRLLAVAFAAQFNFISKKIYDEFWIWSKYLIEAVNAFGCRLKKSKHKICYHLMENISVNNYYLEYVSMFNGPIASSTQPSVALLKQNSSTNGTGIVLQFTNYKKLRYFNCSFVSYFATESERLFISPPFCEKHLNYFAHIVSIYDVQRNENYAQYIEPLNILKQLFNNEAITMTNSASIDGCKYLISILLREISGDECPLYVVSALREWSSSVINIRFNSYLNNKIVCDVDLYCQNIEYLVRFDKLNLMFAKLESIHIDKQLDSIYLNDIDFGPEPLGYHDNSTCIASMLSMLDAINEVSHSKLRQISIECNHEMEIHHWIQYSQLIVDKKWCIEVVQNDHDADDAAADEETTSKIIKLTRTLSSS